MSKPLSTDRTTKQGVPDLNAVGHNGNKTKRDACRHFLAAQLVVIDLEWALDWNGEPYQREVYGRRCLHCGEGIP